MPWSFYNWGGSLVTTTRQDAWDYRQSGRGGEVISLAGNDSIHTTFNTVIFKSVRITGTKKHTQICVSYISTNFA
jgi:hypothetical protein